MYYPDGNYEAFTRPRKPAEADKKRVYIVGTGLADLSAAVFLIRDAQMLGESIHISEELPVAGGSLDGQDHPDIGFVTRGGREMKNHFEHMWNMYRSAPSLEIPGASHPDEYYWLNKDDPNNSSCHLTYKRGNEIPTNGKYLLGKSTKELMKLILTLGDQLRNLTIGDYLSEDFFRSNFWIYRSTIFASEE